MLDTSAVIALPRLRSVVGLPTHPVTTTVTPSPSWPSGRSSPRTSESGRGGSPSCSRPEADLEAVPFDMAAARAFGRVAADLRRAGRKPAARTYDAMIAAIALSRGWPVHTANPADFAHIDGLTVVALPST